MIPQHQQILSVNDLYFTSNFGIGGYGGGPVYFGVEPGQPPKSGTVVHSLKVWYWSNRMARLEIELTDRSKIAFGTTGKGAFETDTFVISPGEKIASLKIWYSNFSTGRSGGFELITDRKRTLSVNAGRFGDPYMNLI